MKTNLILASLITLLTTACGKTNSEVAFGQETGLSSLDAVRSEDASRPEGKSCESEQVLRLKGKKEFVCLYESANYVGEACCIARDNRERFLQVPDNNPRSLGTGSVRHFGGSSTFSVINTSHIYSDHELNCGWNPNNVLLPGCRQWSTTNFGATIGIYQSAASLGYSSEDNGRIIRFPHVKTLVFD